MYKTSDYFLKTKSLILNDFSENFDSSLQYCDGSAKIDKIKIVCSIAEELENRVFNWTLPLIFLPSFQAK